MMNKLAAVIGLALVFNGSALVFSGNALADTEHKIIKHVIKKGDHHMMEQSGHHMMGQREHHVMQYMLSRLDLSDEQQQSIEALHNQCKEQIAALKSGKGERGELHRQLKALIHADIFDEATYRQLLAQKSANKAEVAVIKAKMKNQIWNLLTQDQQTQMEAMHANKREQVKIIHIEHDEN